MALTATEIASLYRQRGTIERQLTLFEKLLDEQEAVETINLELIQTIVGDIMEVFSNFDDIQFQLEGTDAAEEEELKRDELELKYYVAISRAKKLVKRALQVSVKSPQLLSFSGAYKEWSSFFANFTSLVHKNDTISPAQKLQYLRSALNGRAARSIQLLEIKNANYEDAIETLKTKYERTREIVRCHWATLKELPILHKHTPEALGELVDIFRQHLRSMEMLGEPLDSWNIPLTDLILTKFSVENALNWELTRKDQEVPSYKNLLDYLEKRASCSELPLNSSSSNPIDRAVIVQANIPLADTEFHLPDHVDLVLGSGTAPAKLCEINLSSSSQEELSLQMADPEFYLPDHADLVLGSGTAPSKLCEINLSSSSQEELSFQMADPEFYLPDHADLVLGSGTTPSNLCQINLSSSSQEELSLQMADREFYLPDHVHLLLSSGTIPSNLCVSQVKLSSSLQEELYLEGNRIGKEISERSLSKQAFDNYNSCHVSSTSSNKQSTRFREIGEILVSKQASREDIDCEVQIKGNVPRHENGRYMFALPFNELKAFLSESKTMATRRLRSTKRKLANNRRLERAYCEIMQEYIDLGHITEGPGKQLQERGYYRPHHAVHELDRLTTKVRVVFDGSAKTSISICLNYALRMGTTLGKNPLSLSIRLRLHTYIITTDLEQMFRQFRIKHENRQYLEVLWSRSGKIMKTFMLNTVTFVLELSSCRSVRCLRQPADDDRQVSSTYLRCHSTTVLHWLLISSHQLKVSEVNRVKIQTITYTDNSCQRSKGNPADILSRGIYPIEFEATTIWRKYWLSHKQSVWPIMEIANSKEENLNKGKIASKFSSIHKITRIVALCNRFKRDNTFKEVINVPEILQATITLVQFIQQLSFHEKVENLAKKRELNYSRKLLPVNAHRTHLHAGTQATLYALQCRYWFVSDKGTLQKVVRSCTTCRRKMMGDLLKTRATKSRPFSKIGVDYCEPFFIKEKKFRNQRYKSIYSNIRMFNYEGSTLEGSKGAYNRSLYSYTQRVHCATRYMLIFTQIMGLISFGLTGN